MTTSGSAAGTPSGVTAAMRLRGEHHWFEEPTQPPPRRYVIGLILAQFVFFVALLGPAIVGVGLKINSLVGAGVIAEDGAEGALAVLAGVGAACAVVANVVFGRLSDHTRSRWGRRRPWIVAGTSIMTVGLAVMGLAPSLLLATLGWGIAQIGANMTLAPFVATIADQVPRFRRGSITALLGIAQNVGILGGTYVAELFIDNIPVMFIGPSLLAIVAMVVFAFLLPDKVLPVSPPRMTLREWAETFWVDPRRYPDFALAWWSRFLVTLGSFMFTTFRFFFLQRELGLDEGETVRLITQSVLVYTLALVATAWIAGKVSDLLGRRKIFVWSSTMLFALGTVLLAGVSTETQFLLVEVLLGFAYGIYVGVDLALVTDVLPNPDDAGKDLGVFNIANALPQTLAPVIGGALIYVGAYPNYTLLLFVAGGSALAGAIVIFFIKGVR
ncbi:MFS transporter [Brachybacterium phenoliresistens]|uniref:MFS transporter n=1 Tax=Brachybacterium phenoliresistens TaxID=396014 RepID=Z9JQE6_9MICO|nr:MFS transporter [Brachybacterium phenoliresistens]EWS80419.1 MFS transporter [Brachybacterium phenoliresistens]